MNSNNSNKNYYHSNLFCNYIISPFLQNEKIRILLFAQMSDIITILQYAADKNCHMLHVDNKKRYVLRTVTLLQITIAKGRWCYEQKNI